jgi:DNA-binding NarL/FixJ family response regulator
MQIVIADHQDKVRFALRTLLHQQKGMSVVGEAVTADELLNEARLHDPDLVLLHWRLCGEMADLLQEVRQICPDSSVLVLSARPEARCDALAAGADAFACKMDPPKTLLDTIVSLTNGRAQGGRLALPPPAVTEECEGSLHHSATRRESEHPSAVA